MQQIVNKLMEECRKQKDQQLLNDIIDIYNGKYKNYGEYQKAITERNESIEMSYSMVHIIIPDLFYYLLEKSIYNTIKEKRDNAKLEYENNKSEELKGEINAYNDVLSLMESER